MRNRKSLKKRKTQHFILAFFIAIIQELPIVLRKVKINPVASQFFFDEKLLFYIVFHFFLEIRLQRIVILIRNQPDFSPWETENKIGNLEDLNGGNEISVISYIFDFEDDQLARNFADHRCQLRTSHFSADALNNSPFITAIRTFYGTQLLV